jgi:hypothetical protein
MDSYLFLLFTLIFMSVFLFYKVDVKEKSPALLFAIFSLASFCAALLPHVISGAADISARSLYSFACILALTVFAFLIYQHGRFEKPSLANFGLFLAVGLFILLQIKTINALGTQGLIINCEMITVRKKSLIRLPIMKTDLATQSRLYISKTIRALNVSFETAVTFTQRR